MRKVLTTFGDGWFEVTPSKMTLAERDALLDLKTSDEERAAIKKRVQERSSRRASSEDSLAAAEALRRQHEGPFACATVVLPYNHGFVVHSGGWVRF